jgi:hypothetical protein
MYIHIYVYICSIYVNIGVIVPIAPVKKRSKLLSRNRIKEDELEEEVIQVNSIPQKENSPNVYLIHR